MSIFVVKANLQGQLKLLGLKPGMSMFLAGVNVTKQLGFSQFNVGCKWKRNYQLEVVFLVIPLEGNKSIFIIRY